MGDLVTNDPVLAEHAATIRSLIDRAGSDTVEIGRLLTAAKDRLPHGAFGPWLNREFRWSDRTARKFMRIAEVFGGKTEAASVLGTETLYALASDATPEDVRAELVARAAAGEAITRRTVAEARALATVDLATGEIVGPANTDEADRGSDFVAGHFVGLGSGRTYERAKQLIEAVEREAPDLLPFVERGDMDLGDLRSELKERSAAQGARLLAALPDDGGARARADLRAAFWAGAVATRRQLLSLDPALVADALLPEDEARARELVGDMERWAETATSGFGRGLRMIGGGG